MIHRHRKEQGIKMDQGIFLNKLRSAIPVLRKVSLLAMPMFEKMDMQTITSILDQDHASVTEAQMDEFMSVIAWFRQAMSNAQSGDRSGQDGRGGYDDGG